jgi:uncharacterized metal-binding protein
MRKGVIVCGANGERGIILEQVTQSFRDKNASRIIQFSACSVAVSPLMLSMSGTDMSKLIAVNGCKNRCADRILEKNGMKAEHSAVLDDVLTRAVGPCQTTESYDFPGVNPDEVKRFVEQISKMLD